MQAKHTILDLWHKAVQHGIGVTFANTYGETTGKHRYFETCDAFGREDDIRIVKSCCDLAADFPAYGFHHWPALITLFELTSHELDDDYPHRKGVVSSTRDPNINMHSERVTEDNVTDDVEPCDDAYNFANLKDTIDG